MPYIKQEERVHFDWHEGSNIPVTPGELNYLITDICNAYWRTGEKKYQRINDIIGALEGAKLEFYRRVAAPYEDDAIRRNGDVY